MSGTYKRPSWDSKRTNTKFGDFMKKMFFRIDSPCITFLYNKYSKLLNGVSTRRKRDPVVKRPYDQVWDVLGKSVGRLSNMFFKLNSQTH